MMAGLALEFFQSVVAPNELEFRDNPASIRHAFNAIFASDALASRIFHEFRSKLGFESDGKYREELAKRDLNYSIVRNTADALRHFQLGRKSRILTMATQTRIGPRTYGSGVYGAGSFGGQDVNIELDDGHSHHAISTVIKSNEFLLSTLKELSL